MFVFRSSGKTLSEEEFQQLKEEIAVSRSFGKARKEVSDQCFYLLVLAGQVGFLFVFLFLKNAQFIVKMGSEIYKYLHQYFYGLIIFYKGI